MPPGDVAAREDHDHERGAYREGGHRSRPGRDDGGAYREDEEEGPDELDQVFFHGWGEFGPV